METNYTLRIATMEDAYTIWTVMDTCAKAMEHKEHFICDDLDYVKDIISGHGFGVVACDWDENIVGNLLVKYPGMDEDNLGYDVFIKPEETNGKTSPFNILLTIENLNRVLHMDSASVLPKHRGHGLESRMIAYAETLVNTNQYCYACATVAPDNSASLKSLQKNDYKVVVTKEKYGGILRSIMMKILKQ